MMHIQVSRIINRLIVEIIIHLKTAFGEASLLSVDSILFELVALGGVIGLFPTSILHC